ncbi:MAG: glycoside hydrolase family 5 protein [Treponema sp.]|nr:glycoside hydrolase family 5 protein [Treponema sp.]
MKLFKRMILKVCMLMLSSVLFAQTTQALQAPFTKGVNLSKWFEIWEPGIPNLRVYDKSDFEHLKELGCDVIRVPIHFSMFLDQNDNIDPIIFEYLDQACDWAEELGMYIIIDNHSFNSGVYPAPAKVAASLRLVWPQIAERYKKRSNYIMYEILNEPQFKNVDWEPIQEEILKLIRKTDKKHTVVVTGADWSSVNSMCALKPLNDKKIIYTFHFYDPMVFTHQGANWTDKGIEALHDVPFPYDKERMPELTGAAKTSWVAANLRGTYPKSGTESAIRAQLKKAAEFSATAKAPVWCGEMGVYDLVAPEGDRNAWYRIVGKGLKDFNIPFTVWGYDDNFGIFQPNTTKLYPRDLNGEVLQALGMNVPEGVGDMSITNPQTLPLVIYDDFFGKGLNKTTWSMGFFMTNYSKDKVEGSYSLMLGEVDRYGALQFDLTKRPLSEITGKEKKVYLCFNVKFNSERQAFQVRFVDTDDGLGKDIPYRLAYNVNAKDLKVGEWNKVEIQIASMNDWGGWSNITNTWYDSDGTQFDFNRVQFLEFAAEEGSIRDRFYLDDIKIIEK